MALTGACLVLFVTFHCVMNAIAIVWPASYNVICEFLGANWYALIASIGLAALFVLHIIYATILTLQNRKARGTVRYNISKPAPGVEWSSRNMYVLGVVILAFLVVHLIQFWAKMQLVEIRGAEGLIPPAAGTLFLQEAFSLIWTPIVYIIGFIALWFHMNHGFWSMFQTVGWDNTTWIPRLKKISCWWTSVVVLLFIAQAIVFTVRANSDYYKTNTDLRDQYAGMMMAQAGGMNAGQSVPFDSFAQQIHQTYSQIKSMPEEQLKMYEAQDPNFRKQYEMIERFHNFVLYLEGKTEDDCTKGAAQDPYQQMMMQQQMQGAPQGQESEEITIEEQTETTEPVPAQNDSTN